MEALIFLPFLIIAIMIYAVLAYGAQLPGLRLKKKFTRMGKLTGRTIAEIQEVAGPPSTISNNSDGKTTYHWITRGCHISVICNNDLCEKVSHIVDEY